VLSLALYGAWHFIRSVWNDFLMPQLDEQPEISLLVIIRDAENQVEGIIRLLLREFVTRSIYCDIVVVDHASQDLSPLILDRLALEAPMLKVVHLSLGARPINDGMPFCGGRIIHVLDFVNRLQVENFATTIRLVCRH
jgi:hypothetical protein